MQIQRVPNQPPPVRTPEAPSPAPEQPPETPPPADQVSLRERVVSSTITGTRGALEGAAALWLIAHGGTTLPGLVTGAVGVALGMAMVGEILDSDRGPDTPNAKMLALVAGAACGAAAYYAGAPSIAIGAAAGFGSFLVGELTSENYKK